MRTELAAPVAGMAVLFRLYQEVWSNAVVVAPWFGSLVRYARHAIHALSTLLDLEHARPETVP